MSRKFFVCLVLSLLTLLWAHPAQAQRFKWWKNENFQKELALTPAQTSSIEEIFQAAQPPLRAHHRAVEKLEEELSKMIAEGKVEERELEAFVARVEAARADLSKTRTLMLFRIRRLLSAEQHAKLQKLFEQQEKQDRDRRGRPHGSK